MVSLFRQQFTCRSSWQMLFLVMLVTSSLGCGGPRQPRQGQVSGTVTLDGIPLTSGQVSFFSPESGAGGMSPVSGEGHYEIKGLQAPGTYEITVTPQEPTPDGPPVPPSNLPKKYASASTSELSFSLKAGSNIHPLELKK